MNRRNFLKSSAATVSVIFLPAAIDKAVKSDEAYYISEGYDFKIHTESIDWDGITLTGSKSAELTLYRSHHEGLAKGLKDGFLNLTPYKCKIMYRGKIVTGSFYVTDISPSEVFLISNGEIKLC